MTTVLERVAQRLAGPVPSEEALALEADPHRWLRRLFPAYTVHPFGPHHEQFWAWLWSIEVAIRPAPFVGAWARGGAKSTSAEMAVVAIGARKVRRYGLYICETQDQADDHVGNIAAMLEQRSVEDVYPTLASRMVGKYGNSKGWRRNRLRTGTGFTVDALGLDSAARGVKLEDARPDFMVIDDIDDNLDGPEAVEKKIATLTHKIIPAGASNCAILAIQNLVHPDSIFSRLVDGRAEFLANRIISGPVPAIEGLTYTTTAGRTVLTGGRATWAGQSLAACQGMVDDMGITAFRSECQHEVEAPPGGMFDHLDFQHCTWAQVPELVRTVVFVDPAVTDKDTSDSMGIQADGLAANGKVYRLWSWEQRTSPLDALRRAILKALEIGAEAVGVETDQGGDTWESVYREAWALVQAELRAQLIEDHGAIDGLARFSAIRCPRFISDKAGAGYGPKTHRASQMLADYERGIFVHVEGTHTVLERALRRFPKTKPYDLTDAAFWAWNYLCRGKRPAFLGAA